MNRKTILLQDADLARWHTNLTRGSQVTANVYLRRLDLFCRQHTMTPHDLITIGSDNQKQLEDLLFDHITWMEDSDKSPGYIEGVLKALKSWLRHHGIDVKRQIKISNRGSTPTLDDERVPSKEELRTLLMAGDERASALICLIAQSGLRPQVLGNADGTDGLQLRDLPEIKVHKTHVELTQIPTRIVVKPALSKANHQYFSFLPQEGCDYLIAYLNMRCANSDALTPKSPVIANKMGYRIGTSMEAQFMTTRNVSRIIRATMRPRFTWRPYVLRAYFDTQLLLAESHGKISHPYRVFLMGHKGDMEARYSTNKRRLPPDLIEDMRNAFAASAEYLETIERSKSDKKTMLLEMWRQQASMYGIDPMKVRIEKEKELGKGLSVDEELELMTLEIKKRAIPQHTNGDNPYQSKIVTEHELVSCIEEGWEIVREVSGHRYLMKRANHITAR
jgi:hypothetical protein